jgi:DNA-binding MarR family transcriptional regulator
VRDVSDSLSGQAGLLVELLSAAMEPELVRAGLTLSSFELLSAVHASGGKSSQADIARRLGITPPSLSEAVRYATQKGLVEQIPDPTDGRLKRLRLTAVGRKAVHGIMAAVNATEDAILAEADVSRLADAIALLRELNRNLARRLSGTSG